MKSVKKENLLKISNDLIVEADLVIASEFKPQGSYTTRKYVDLILLHRWWNKVKNFSHMLGITGNPWKEILSEEPEYNNLTFVKKKKGVLEAIKYEIEHDHLQSITQMIHVDTLCDLSEQADHLLEQGYFLAAGVIGRAILEEHLRSTCDLHELSTPL